MVTIQFTYYDIQSEDWTGVIVNIIDKEGNAVSTYRNFEPDDIEDLEENPYILHQNQTEEFEVPTVELARKLVESNRNYVEVEVVK